MGAAVSSPPQSALPPVAVEVLESLCRHRLLTAAQVKALHMPEGWASWTHRVLAALRNYGLAECVRGGRRANLWFATQPGVDALAAIGAAPAGRRAVTPAQAAGPLRAHTLAVNEACISFVTAARDRDGDECGPLSWQHEVAHRLSVRGPRGPAGMVIADALLGYLQTRSDGSLQLHQRLIELDRGTTPPQQLAEKLARYSQLHNQPPSTPEAPAPDWRTRYRTFPGVLVIIAIDSVAAARRRIQRVIALRRAQPQTTAGIQVSFVLLGDLIAHGPFAEVFIAAEKPDRYLDWLGNPQPQER
jgi:Replication-relaxation